VVSMVAMYTNLLLFFYLCFTLFVFYYLLRWRLLFGSVVTLPATPPNPKTNQMEIIHNSLLNFSPHVCALGLHGSHAHQPHHDDDDGDDAPFTGTVLQPPGSHNYSTTRWRGGAAGNSNRYGNEPGASPLREGGPRRRGGTVGAARDGIGGPLGCRPRLSLRPTRAGSAGRAGAVRLLQSRSRPTAPCSGTHGAFPLPPQPGASLVSVATNRSSSSPNLADVSVSSPVVRRWT